MQAMEAAGEHVAEEEGVQKGLRGFLKQYGYKMSKKAVAKWGSRAARGGNLLHFFLAGGMGVKAYNQCMAE